ncbi:MAG: RDD family protein [Phycisphaerae bacterium]|nr:RDD family protein [Phycisphaerae bacterium]
MNEEQLVQSEDPQPEGETVEFAGYAGFWKRVAATVIDSFILAPAAMALLYAFDIPLKTANFLDIPLKVQIAAFFVETIYNALLEFSPLQGSIGKIVLRIKVTDIYGDRIGLERAFIRNLSKIVSRIIFFVGYLMIAFTPRKQGLHDMIANCAVINKSF